MEKTVRRSFARPGHHAKSFLFGLLVLSLFLPACKGDDKGTQTEQESDEPMLALAQTVADTWIRSVRPEQNDWSWGDGVLMFGMSQLAARTGMTQYGDYIQEWMDHHIAHGYYVAFSDNCPPGIAAVRLYERTGEARYRTVMERTWHYLQNVAARTSDGGLNHMGFITGKQLWVDSLFMFGIYLNEMGRVEQDSAYWEEQLDQIRIFSRHLRDGGESGDGNGLYRHMWDDRKKTVTPEQPIFWARGNAWVFVSLVEILSNLPQEDPGRDAPLAYLTRMAETLAVWQKEGGLWHTLVMDPGTYLETSASALFAYGYHKAMRMGLLDSRYEDVVRKAMAGIQTQLFQGCEGGVIVSGTSHGTSPGDSEYYANVTTGDQVPYGVGAFLLAAVETGAWPAASSFPQKEGCPDLPEIPENWDDFLGRAVYRLETADLEGAREDFQILSGLKPEKGQGPFGEAFIETVFTAFHIYDTFVRFTIREITWTDLRETIRSEVLPSLDRIQEKFMKARDDSGFSLSIPVLQINRRGVYTPIKGLTFDSGTTGDLLLVLNVLEVLLVILS